MVEFALGLPILLVLLFGVIEFGRLLFIYTATTASSREAARYAAVAGVNGSGILRYKDCAGIRAAARRIGSLAGIQDSDITISYDNGDSPYTAYATCATLSGAASSGHRVRVQVVAHYDPIVPLIDLPGFDITSFTARTLIMNVVIDP
jgi:Flp pilus assembly protein TadG